MLLSPQAVEFLTRISSKLIYGTIILTAVIGSLSDPLPRNLRVIVIVFISLYAVNLANSYAFSINEDMRKRRTYGLAEQWVTLLKPGWLMGSALIPVFFFGAAAAGLMAQATALKATKVSLLFLVLFVGFISRRVCGGGIMRSLASGMSIALLGYVVIQLKLWTKYLPSIGS